MDNPLKKSFPIRVKGEEEDKPELTEVFDQDSGAASFLNEKQSVNEQEDEELSDVDVEEGKMKEILGVPEDEDIEDAYDGSPQDAAEELVDEVGEGEAASMINWAANISGSEFLEGMQDALKDINESSDPLTDVLEDLNEGDVEESADDAVLDDVLDRIDEEDPCWDGYTMVGKKTDEDGNEVPNCVPDDEVENYQEESNALTTDNILQSVLEEKVSELNKLDELAEKVLNG